MVGSDALSITKAARILDVKHGLVNKLLSPALPMSPAPPMKGRLVTCSSYSTPTSLSQRYYQIARVRQFWDWLVSGGIRGQVKIPGEIYEEIKRGKDDLWDWLRYHKSALLFDEEVDLGMVDQVMKQGYALNATKQT